jgi:hypothetical protein
MNFKRKESSPPFRLSFSRVILVFSAVFGFSEHTHKGAFFRISALSFALPFGRFHSVVIGVFDTEIFLVFGETLCR